MKNVLIPIIALLFISSPIYSQVTVLNETERISSSRIKASEVSGPEDPEDGPDEYLGEIRKRWQEQIHRTAPEVNWKMVEHDNMMNKYRRVLSERSAQQKEIFANGRICGNWSERGSINQSGCAQGGDYDSTDNSLYVMGCNGNLFKGYADRCQWNPVNDNLKFSNQIIKVTKNAQGGKRILCNLGLNIFYSDDEGVTFNPSSGILFPVSWPGNKMVQLESLGDSARTLLLITRPWDGVTWSDRYMLYKSSDHGATWTQIFKFPSGVDYRLQMWVPALQRDHAYILLNQDASNVSRLYRFNRQTASVDLVNTSTDLPTNVYLQFSGNESGSATVLYALANYTLYKSVNMGINWTRMVNAPTGMGVLDVSISDPNKVIVGGLEAFRSMDGGNSWTMVNPRGEYYGNPLNKLHADIRKVKFYLQRDGSEFAIINCDGGSYRSDNFLVTVTNLSLTGLNIGQYYDGIADNQGRLFLGSQDQGFQRADSTITRTGLLAFQQVIAGDYGNLQLTRNKQTLWSQYPGGNMYYCYNSMGPINRTWSLPGTTKPLSGWMLATAPVYPASNNQIYLGGGNINGGAGSYVIKLTGTSNNITASQINFDFRGTSNFGIAAIGTTATDTNVIYVAREDGKFYYSTNAGAGFTQTSGFSGPTPLYLYGTCILASQKTKNLVWYAGSGYSNPGVYKSTDGGANFSPMVNGLPSTLVYRIAANSNETMLFAATEAGPYVYIAADNYWYSLDNGSAPAQNYWAVNFDSVANAVHFYTYGRGLWDFIIGNDSAAVSISASSNNICQGQTVSFTASPVSGGASPVFQWKKNGINVAGNGANYTTNTLANGDRISCEMISSLDCVNAGGIAVSNGITMNVISSGITPAAGSNSPVCSGSSLNLSA